MTPLERKAWRVTLVIVAVVLGIVACAWVAPDLFPEDMRLR